MTLDSGGTKYVLGLQRNVVKKERHRFAVVRAANGLRQNRRNVNRFNLGAQQLLVLMWHCVGYLSTQSESLTGASDVENTLFYREKNQPQGE